MARVKPSVLRCSLCGASFDAVNAIDSERVPGRYCAVDCLEAMRAVYTLRVTLERDVVADSLLALYRCGMGPAPALVFVAVRRALSRGNGRVTTVTPYTA